MKLRGFSWLAVAALVCAGALSYIQLSDKLAGEVTKLKRELSAVKRGHESGPAVIREAHVASPNEPLEAGAHALPGASASANAPPPELTEEDQAALDEKRKKYLEARVALLQREYTNEPEDSEWSKAAEAKLDELYSGPEFQSLRVTAACKYTLCRIDVASLDAQQGPQALQKFMDTHPWSGRRFTHLDLERGEGSAYLVREGFNLPTLDPTTIEN